MELLRYFSKDEHAELRIFLGTEYFYKHLWRNSAEVLRLYDYIMKYGAEEHSPELQKACVSKIFFPDKPYLEHKKTPLDSLTTDLLGIIYKFVAFQGSANPMTEYHGMIALMRMYRRFGNEERFIQVERQLRSLLEMCTIKDVHYYNTLILLEEEVVNYGVLLQSAKLQESQNRLHLYLDYYYTLKKVEYMAASFIQGQIFLESENEEIDMDLPNAALKFIKEKALTHNPIFYLFNQVILLQQTPLDEELLLEFEVLLEQYDKFLSVELKITFAAHYRNFYAQYYSHTGRADTQKKLFEIFRQHLEKGLLYYDGYLHVSNLRMLTMHALKLGEVEWVKDLLEQHPPEKLCGTKYLSDASNLNWAEYYFFLRLYSEALVFLTNKSFEHPVLSIIAEILLIKIYFETDNDLLDSRLFALDQKVRRSKLSKVTKGRHFNFVRLLGKLDRYKWDVSGKKFQRLLKEIKEIPDISHREWLWGKATEVQHSHHKNMKKV